MSRMIFPLSRRVSYRIFERWSWCFFERWALVFFLCFRLDSQEPKRIFCERGGHWCFFMLSPGKPVAKK